MKLTTKQKWLRTIAWLRRNFQIDCMVYVKSTPLKKMHGYTQCEIRYYQIVVNRKQSFALRVDTLIHEWAHVISGFEREIHNNDHNAEWGLAYARIYRTFVEWNYGKEFKPEEE